jgi:TPR repeat protein
LDYSIDFVLLMRVSSYRSPELLAWYEVRDNLLGENYVEQDIKKALILAAVCQHPNAVWLTKLFAGRDVKTPEEVRQVFLSCEDDPRRICFAAVIGVFDEAMLRQAANKGYACAQAWMARETAGEEKFRWAQKAASQGERDGFYMLALCYEDGLGCERSIERAKENYLAAAELGRVSGMCAYGKLLDKSDPQRLVWMGRALPYLGASAFVFLNEIMDFNAGTRKANVVFVIGRALRGHVDLEKRFVFGKTYKCDSQMRLATQAIQFYKHQLQSYRIAVDCWTLVGIRLGVVKDVRKMIEKMIWEAREEARYELNCEIGCRCPFCDVT